jgi:hypothetical protein
MKRVFILLFISIIAISCGSSKSGKAIADEVCDCYSKANALPTSDPERTKKQDDCLKEQSKSWDKVKDDKEKSDEFNKRIAACSSEQIKKSFGQ